MRFKVKEKRKHTEIVAAVAWTQHNELFSVSDDMTIWKWDMNGEPISKLMDIEVFITDFHWIPGQRVDTLVAGCTDGSFKLI